jgi:T4 RnlA family RNA ligase
MLPTLEQCLEICANNISFKFKQELIDGMKVYQFTYFLAKHNDFINPLNQPENAITITAEELRGLTFVEQSDSTYRRFFMLHKFFNMGQVPGYLYHEVKDHKILKVQDKRDGSMISFVNINDNVYAKSKYSFQSEQAVVAQNIYNTNEGLRDFVDYSLNNNIQPIFELTSPMNQIVLRYSKTELKIIQLRDATTGMYVTTTKDFRDMVFEIYGIEFADELPLETYTFEKMIELRETITGIEGWVVTTERGMLKIKTEEYIRLHHLMTDSITKENEVIRMTLDEEIDDVLAEIPIDALELRFFVETISDGIIDHVNEFSEKIKEMYIDMKTLYPERKDFAIACKPSEYFGLLMRAYHDPSDEAIEKEVINYVKSKTSKLGLAKEYLKELCIDARFESKDED